MSRFQFVLFLSLVLSKAAEPPVPTMPMPIRESDTAMHRWLSKSVLDSRLLDNMEQTNQWSHHGLGEMSLSRQRSKDGKRSIRLSAPTRTDQPNRQAPGRPFGEAAARRDVPGEDWSHFNRVSFWVYPYLPGFKVISMLVKLHNDGDVKVPDRYGREGLNYFLLKPHRWNHVVWEIPHLARDRVTGIDFIYRLQGNEPDAASTATFYIDRLELQRVVPDYFEGWTVAPGEIAYSHTGYSLGGTKTALASDLPGKEFKLVDAAHRKTVLTKAVQVVKSPLPAAPAPAGKTNAAPKTPLTFQVLDFSEVRAPGRYFIQTDATKTQPFEIGDNPWRDTIWKTINFFYCQRCGTEIPGIHDVCHADWQAQHDGQTLTVNGGWHDAGDLSQGLVNTAEAVHAMFSLAERLRDADSVLAERLMAEARWGLEWIHKTRFDDGFRVTWGTMDFWTDNQTGTVDDMKAQVRGDPFDILLAAAAEAIGARVLKGTDSALPEKSLELARADWEFAIERVKSPNLELAAAGAFASMELFKATGEQLFASKAAELANVISACQQREWPAWEIPLTGFFYNDARRNRIFHAFHRSHEQLPVVALVELCRAFPRHVQWMDWYTTIALYSDYLKNASSFTAPYRVLPASIYDLAESRDPRFVEQVREGVPLDATHYLRLFPVWFDFRGHFGVLLSQTKALAAAAQLRGNLELADLAQSQLKWVVGRNPFAQSTLFGEGHDYAPQYSAMSGDIAGSFPVGIQTRARHDVPYWPAANCYNYKEVWVHPASRWLSILADLAEPAVIIGRNASQDSVQFTEASTGLRYSEKPNNETRQFVGRLPEGHYSVEQDQAAHLTITLMPASVRRLDLQEPIDINLTREVQPDGRILIHARLNGAGRHTLELRVHNLAIEGADRTVELKALKPETLTWEATRLSSKEPWIALIIPDGDLAGAREILAR